MNWQKVIHYFSEYYFTNLLLLFISTLFLWYGIINDAKLKKYRVFYFYACMSISQTILASYINLFQSGNKEFAFVIQGSINIFTILEFLIFYYFLIKRIRSVFIKRLMRLFIFLFIFITAYFWGFTNEFFQNPARLTVIESFLIIFSCLFYFYELFKYPLIKNLLSEPSFWMVTGMLFLFSSIVPLFLIHDYIAKNFSILYDNLYSINFIAYSLLFVLFIIGFRCQMKISI